MICEAANDAQMQGWRCTPHIHMLTHVDGNYARGSPFSVPVVIPLPTWSLSHPDLPQSRSDMSREQNKSKPKHNELWQVGYQHFSRIFEGRYTQISPFLIQP